MLLTDDFFKNASKILATDFLLHKKTKIQISLRRKKEGSFHGIDVNLFRRHTFMTSAKRVDE